MVKAVIAAGGIGASLLPMTKAVAKEILPIGGRPVIDYIVRELHAAGVSDILIVSGKSKQAIEDYFDSAPELERALKVKGDTAQLRDLAGSTAVNLYFIHQKAALGIGSALQLASDFVDGENFYFVLSDDVLPVEGHLLQDLWQIHQQTGRHVLASVPIPVTESQYYGVIDWQADTQAINHVRPIAQIHEKQPIANGTQQDAVLGRYVFSADIFEQLNQLPVSENQFAAALNALAAQDCLSGLAYTGAHQNIDGHLGLLKANIALALKDPDTAEPLRAYLRQRMAD